MRAKFLDHIGTSVAISLVSIVTIFWCCTLSGIIPQVVLPMVFECDDLNYLTNRSTADKIRAAVEKFGQQHGIQLSQPSMIICAGDDRYWFSLDYKTSPRVSKYKFTYELNIDTHYSLRSDSFDLKLNDEISQTQSVLNYLTALETSIGEFETTPRVALFIQAITDAGLNQSSVGQISTDGHSLTLTCSAPRTSSFVTPASASLTYSMPTHALASYSLPNAFTWDAFPELHTVHQIAITQILTDATLSTCSISTAKTANTTIELLTAFPSIEATIALTCTTQQKLSALTLLLHPDGTYTITDTH